MNCGQNENVSLALASVYTFTLVGVKIPPNSSYLSTFVKNAVFQDLGQRVMMMMMAITLSDQ